MRGEPYLSRAVGNSGKYSGTTYTVVPDHQSDTVSAA
jgi:hypothetical protein